MTLAPTNNQESPAGLILYEEPTAVLARASKWADALMKVVNEREMYASIQGKRYLEVEAWQLVGMFSQAHAVAGPPVALHDDATNPDRITGYECTAELIQGGVVIGRGTMSCGMESFPTQGKEGSEKDKAAKSAAQTWAVSKSYRNTFGFVAKLAGFEATTADEMRTTTTLATDPEMLCPYHNLEWFKRGAMKQFAHTIEGEKGPRGGTKWCNQEDVMTDLSNSMKTIARVQQWDDAAIQARSKEWLQMTPAEKLHTINQWTSVDPDTGELPQDGPQGAESDVQPPNEDQAPELPEEDLKARNTALDAEIAKEQEC